MFKIAKEFSFDMAHMLDGHDGKCKNLHGHTYKLQVEVAGELVAEGAKRGMVMDYADLKTIVKTHILDPMDHAFIYDLKQSKREQGGEFVNRFRFKSLWHSRPIHGGRDGKIYV